MKCPKCDYLGFETGDRCRNCGYDFSLLSVTELEPADYEIHPAAVDDVPVHVIDDMTSRHSADDGIDDSLRISLTPQALLEEEASLELGADFGRAVMTPEPEPAPEIEPEPEPEFEPESPAPPTVAAFLHSAGTGSADSALPLFTPSPDDEDDEPLIKLPAAPRPPLAVRRTPDTPRLRAVPRATSRPALAPVLQFTEDVAEPPVQEPQPQAEPVERAASAIITGQSSRPGARVVAVLIDHAILGGIDVGVLYFTLRMAGLAMSDWRLLPVAPMLTFLGLLTIAYFYAFTAVGGQTIGKMAVGICVVTDAGAPVDAARAMRRTSAGVLSFLLLGLGFIPALLGDHRALHDRLAGTRVVRLRSV